MCIIDQAPLRAVAYVKLFLSLLTPADSLEIMDGGVAGKQWNTHLKVRHDTDFSTNWRYSLLLVVEDLSLPIFKRFRRTTPRVQDHARGIEDP